MADAYLAKEMTELPIDLEILATQSELYKALVNFHGKDAINVLNYPICGYKITEDYKVKRC